MTDLGNSFERFLRNEFSEEDLDKFLGQFLLEAIPKEAEELIEEELSRSKTDEDLSPRLQIIVNENKKVLSERVDKKGLRILLLNTGIKWATIAASLLFILSIALFNNTKLDSSKENAIKHEDITPGKNQATLTFDDGQELRLKRDSVGIINDGAVIRYTDGDVIRPSTAVRFGELNIPRNGEYRATLSDGTKVWFNADTKFRYPLTFSGKERIVELQTGEAYFEVAHDSEHPFIVITRSQRLKVLGTVFNINSYDEQRTITTLVSGRIQLDVKGKEDSKYLLPGQQASLIGSDYGISNVDTDQYVAWKKGEFRFVETPLPEVMKQLERWYGLEMDYTKIPDGVKIHAAIKRNKSLSSVLHAIEKVSNLKFKIEGRRVEVVN